MNTTPQTVCLRNLTLGPYAWLHWCTKKALNDAGLEQLCLQVSHLSSHDLYLILLGVILSANEVTATPGLSPYTDSPVTTHSYVQTPQGLLSRPEAQPLRCGLRWEDGWMNRTLFWQSLWDWGYSPWQDVFSDLLNSSCWKKTRGCHSNGFMYDACVKTHASLLTCHLQDTWV